MEQEKNYSLLRPFDLEAAKEGAAIDDTFGGRVVFVDGPDAGGKYAVRIDGHFAAVLGENLRMAPLCWVEGRPVYKGDKLWNKFAPAFVYIADQVEGDVLRSNGLTTGNREEVINLTWTQPKVKRSGWIVFNPAMALTEDQAERMAHTVGGIPKRIEWEE